MATMTGLAKLLKRLNSDQFVMKEYMDQVPPWKEPWGTTEC